MAYTYWLPDEHGQKTEHGTSSNAVIMIGANGSGKSKLGAWMEMQDFENVHRISGQRSLNFSESIPLMDCDGAVNLLLTGSKKADINYKYKNGRWGSGLSGGRHLTTTLLKDFDTVLAALLALNSNEEHNYFLSCQEMERLQLPKPAIPERVSDKLFSIWDQIFPQRKLILNDAKLYAYANDDEQSYQYSATEMSDGERAVLYLAAQVLCVPENKTLIIDEPEIHLHRSIMNQLWRALEQLRQDCLFIYITHDTQFAAMHSHADKIWVKEYDGTNWILEDYTNKDLPEELLLDILGSRKNVLFVEGEKNSFDTRLYSELYPSYHIIPCGSCSQVIARTKAFRGSPTLHDCQVFGIIDRDYRSDYEMEAYKTDGIFTLEVAEVENLFIIEELIKLIAGHMGKTPDDTFSAVKNYVVKERFSKQINSQICQSVVSRIKYQLSSVDISAKNEGQAKDMLETALSGINYDDVKSNEETRFQNALSGNDYAEVIKLFNEKNIAKSIGHFLGLQDKEYCSTVIALLRGNKHDEILNAISPYLPAEIPR